jgi:dihydroorotate dehydrogenase (fumarate)
MAPLPRRATFEGVDLSSSYLGLRLAGPVVPGASPLTSDLDSIRRLEDAGAPAVVLSSLFEEQVAAEALGGAGGPTEPDLYLSRVRAAKEAVSIPVIASLNGTTSEGWISFAHLVEQARADALELNLFHISTNLWSSGATAEAHLLEGVAAARRTVAIPIAVKIFPYFSSIASLARQLEEVGANGLVLFNRLYQPDIDLEAGEISPDPRLSSSSELLARLNWIAMLAGRVDVSLAASGGVHTAADVLKCVLAGADVTQMVSALIVHGPDHLRAVNRGVADWLERNGHEALDDVRGQRSLERLADPRAFPRAGYLHVLQGWKTAERRS